MRIHISEENSGSNDRAEKLYLDGKMEVPPADACQEPDFRHAKDKCRDVRQGWAEAAKHLHAEGGDELLIPDVFVDESFDDWTGPCE